MKIFGWILNNRVINLLYGERDDEQTRINKTHGILLILLYLLAFALGLFFYEFNQYKLEWRQRTMEDSEIYREAIKKYYQQFDTTKVK